METKPVYCPECGAKLTGGVAFCSVCGAKQQMAAQTPVTEPAPVVRKTPAAAPENSLAAPKKKLSVPGLILAIFALAVTFFTEMSHLYLLGTQPTYGAFELEAFAQAIVMYLRSPQVYVGLLTAWVLPAAAVVLVLLKKKPAALAGLITTGVILVLQIFLSAYYTRYATTYGGSLPRLFYAAYQLFNGEGLFRYLRSVFSGARSWLMSAHTGVQLGYFMKNVWALLACLFALTKRQK